MSVRCTIENLLFSKTLHVKGIVIAAHQPFCWLECGKKQSLKLPNNSVVLTDGGSGPPPPPKVRRDKTKITKYSRGIITNLQMGAHGRLLLHGHLSGGISDVCPSPSKQLRHHCLNSFGFSARPAIGLLDIQKSKKGFDW